jgi:hypothetical protein
MLGEQQPGPAPVLARLVGQGIKQHLYLAVRHHHQPEANPAAELLHLRQPAGPGADREVDGIGQCQPVDALQHQAQAEAALELHHDRRVVPAHGDDVAPVHLALHVIALRGEEVLDRRIKLGLGRQRPSITLVHQVDVKPSRPIAAAAPASQSCGGARSGVPCST